MIGRTVSHYTILEKLGEGGMGVVYKAEDTKLHRIVALKFLPHDVASDPAAKKRFIHEAQSASVLDHPNICTIFEVGETESGELFIVMSYCEGKSIKTRLSEGHFEIPDVIKLAIQIARGLSNAHEHRIVHRDIKPHNIMVTSDGTVKIVDFGLAKIMNASQITQSAATLGTVAYMPPEQLQGGVVDERSDIWSLGVVLYEMLAGVTPFRGDHPMAMSYSIVNEDPQPISRYRKDIPVELESLLISCLQKDKSLRPQSGKEVIALLEGKPTKTSAAVPRRFVMLLVGIILIVGAAILYLIYHPPTHQVSGMKEAGVAVMKFTAVSTDTMISRWPGSLQILIGQGLSGIQGITVFDPVSLDGLIQSAFGTVASPPPSKLYETLQGIGVTMLVDGKIIKLRNGYGVYVNLISPQDAKLLYSVNKSLSSEEELPSVAEDFTREILDYLNVQSTDRAMSDLEPWRLGTRNIEAIKAFEIASGYVYRVERGGEEYLRQALQFDSGFISPRIWLISSLAQSGRYQEAKRHYEILLGLKPRANSFDKAMIEWCDAFLKNDKFLQEQALTKALDYSKANNILLANLGNIRYALGAYQSALDALLPTVRMRWQYGPVYSLAAKCYLKLGKSREARQVLEGSLALPHPSADSYALLAALSIQQGDTAKADEYTSKALQVYHELNYSWEEVNEYIGSDFLIARCWNEAIIYFQMALHRTPASASAHEGIADALFGMGRWKSALDEYNAALRLDSTLVEVHFAIGRICEGQNKPGDALYHYRLFLTHDSLSVDALNAKKRVEAIASAYQAHSKY